MESKELEKTLNAPQTKPFKSGFFKYDKALHNKLHSGCFVRSPHRAFFDYLVSRIDQSAKAKRNGGYVTVRYDDVTALFKTPSQFSKAKRDLAERKIILLKKTTRRCGKGENVKEIEFKRYNDIAINQKLSEWIPYVNGYNKSRLSLVAMGLKARLESVEKDRNALLQEGMIEVTSNLHEAILNSTLMREHYIPTFGLRLAEELLNTLSENALAEKSEIEINAILKKLFKSPHAQQIAMQREIYRKRHKSLAGDFMSFEKCYVERIGGINVEDPFLSLLYSHRSRINNMDKAFLTVERIRRLTRASLLSENLVIMDDNDVERYFDYKAQNNKLDVCHISPITQNSSIEYGDSLVERMVRNIAIPKGQYPIAQWDFQQDKLIYPEFKAGDRPVQLWKGQLYKTHSSDISDNIITAAKAEYHVRKVSDATKNALLNLESFEMGYIRAYNPDYHFEPEIYPVNTVEEFLVMHTNNITRLFDCNLISEDDFEIGLQILLDQAKMSGLPYQDPHQAELANLIHYVENAPFCYSQKAAGLTLARFANKFDFNRPHAFVIGPHKSAFDVSKAKDYTENHFSKRIRELLETNDRTAYVDPFVTYAFKNAERNEVKAVQDDQGYEDYLDKTTVENNLTIEQIFSYLYEDKHGSDWESYKQLETPPIPIPS